MIRPPPGFTLMYTHCPNTTRFRSSNEKEAIRKKARELVNAVIGPRAAAVDREEAYPWDNVRALREAGFVGMTIPRDLGGPGLGFLEVALVIEEMARVCGVTGRIAVEANMGAVSAIMRSEEHTSELQSLMRISYAVFCLKTKTQHSKIPT